MISLGYFNKLTCLTCMSFSLNYVSTCYTLVVLHKLPSFVIYVQLCFL